MIAQSLILSLFLIRAVSSSPDNCVMSSCDTSQPQVRFPFQLNEVQPERCRGYLGFDLSCDSSRFTIIRLSNSSFRVQNIDYGNQQIWLNDPNQCLSRLLLTLNLSGTPFRSDNPQELALFNCSSNSSIPSGFDPVSCLGDVNDRNYTVFATASPAPLPGARCALVRNISVPALWPWNGNGGRSSVVPEDIRLTWDEPWCGGCETMGGICGLKPDSDRDVECTVPGALSMHVQRTLTIVLGILLAIGLFFVAKTCKRYDPPLYPWLEYNPPVTPQVPTTMSGLDQATIDSFPKTVLGESVRISRTENNVCAICLGEYKPNDSLRTIPVCHHFFHSNCIDEWLHRNPTCPICRESQKQSPELVHALEP